jgi:hypothetical protein
VEDRRADRPSPQNVARRALALAVYKYRATYEDEWLSVRECDREQLEEDWQDMGAFLKETHLEDSLSRYERTLFFLPLGKWHPQDAVNGNWSGENLLVLLWALGRGDALPHIWEQSVGVHCFADEEAERWDAFVAEATLRPSEELERMEGYVQAVRLRERTPDDFEGIPWLAEKGQSFGGGPPIEGDLPIDGKPYRRLSDRDKRSVRSIALERHKALCWLLGFESDLDAPASDV